MSQSLNRIIFSQSDSNALLLKVFELTRCNLSVDDVVCSLRLQGQHDQAKTQIQGIQNADFDLIENVLPHLLSNERSTQLLKNTQCSNLLEISEYFKNNFNTSDLIIHLENGEWFMMTQNEQAQSEQLLNTVNFLKLLYTLADYPSDLIEMLFTDQNNPLSVFKIESYSKIPETIFKICPFYLDAPENLEFEDNYMLNEEFVN